MYSLSQKQTLNYIILMMTIVTLSGCETFFGAPGKTAKNSRTASLEHRRDEEIFSAAYEILFDSNSAALNSDARAEIDHIAELIKKSNPTLIAVSGYSDSFGDAVYNKAMSRKRATTVSKALKARGVDGALIRTEAFGEEDPSVPTQDNVKILENRRVVIEIRK